MIFAFLLSYLIGTNTGPDGAGIFYFCFTIYMLVASVSRIGTDQSIVKYTVNLKYKYQVLNTVYGVSCIVLLCCCFSILILGITSSLLYKKNYIEYGIYKYLTLYSPTVIFFSLMFVFSNFLQALGKPKSYIFFISLLSPALTCILIFILDIKTPKGVLTSNMFGTLMTVLFCLCYLKNTIKIKIRWKFKKILNKESLNVIKNSFPFTIISLLVLFNQWYPIIFIGYISGMDEAGVFSIGHRVSLVFSSFSVIVGSVFAPKFIKARCDKVSLKSLIFQSFSLLTIMGGIGVFILLFFSDYIFSIFGKGFESASEFFPNLVISQFILVFTVILGWVMISLEKQKQLTCIILFISLSNIVFLFIYFYIFKNTIINSICFSLISSSAIHLLLLIFFVSIKINRL